MNIYDKFIRAKVYTDIRILKKNKVFAIFSSFLGGNYSALVVKEIECQGEDQVNYAINDIIHRNFTQKTRRKKCIRANAITLVLFY